MSSCDFVAYIYISISIQYYYCLITYRSLFVYNLQVYFDCGSQFDVSRNNWYGRRDVFSNN